MIKGFQIFKSTPTPHYAIHLNIKTVDYNSTEWSLNAPIPVAAGLLLVNLNHVVLLHLQLEIQ